MTEEPEFTQYGYEEFKSLSKIVNYCNNSRVTIICVLPLSDGKFALIYRRYHK